MWKESKLIAYIQHKLSALGKQQLAEKIITLPSGQYRICLVRYRDITRLLAVERAVYAGKAPWDASAFLFELSSSVPHRYLQILDANQTIAFIGCRIQNFDAHITNFAVLPAFQSKGLGTCLLNEIKDYAISERCITLSLEVRMDNKSAQRLYRRYGFVSRSVKANYYHEDQEDALDMVLELEDEKA